MAAPYDPATAELYRQHHLAHFLSKGLPAPSSIALPRKPSPSAQTTASILDEDPDADGESDEDIRSIASSSSDSEAGDEDMQDTGEEAMDEEDENRRWCICRGISRDLMIGCDDPNCRYGWLHADCLGLKEVPEGEWYCPECTAKHRQKRGQRY